MNDAASTPTAGHPKGLYVLFGAEMFERFCYYGMRTLLTLYLVESLLMGDEKAFSVYGAYTALVYAAPVIGGKLAEVLCGGDCSPTVPVTEERLLELECEAFLSLCGEEKTQARLEHMLMKNKPLRN